MTIELYRQAVQLLEESDELGPLRFPVLSDDINALEKRLGVPLPESYRAMLEDFGIMMFLGETIYGIGKSGFDTKGGSGVLFQTEVARKRGQITPTMVRILSSGYGPEFCIECAEMQPSGEAPVYLVPADGDLDKVKKVADSFGAFLLNEVQMNLKDTTV